MATRRRPGHIAAQALISIVVAVVLVGLATLARAALGPKLGGLSPFMLYVAAVLIAGLVRGPVCGALVMLGGGVSGFILFLAPHGVAPPGSVAALMIFWGFPPRCWSPPTNSASSSGAPWPNSPPRWSVADGSPRRRLSAIGLNFPAKGVW